MPRRSGKVPSYTKHKASGQAVVRINGKDHYLGVYGTPESHDAYERLIAEWRVAQIEASRAEGAPTQETSHALTVNAVILAYMKFAEEYYSKDGKTTQEYTDMKYALRPLRKLSGTSDRLH